MEKRWVLKSQGDPLRIKELAEVLHIDQHLANLLFQRGVTTFDEAKAFLRPSLDQLHDPYLMKDMDKAVARIELALSRKEKILVYGDYDVDGTSAVALVYSFFRNIHDQIDYYIPDRYTEGYGISFQGIDNASDRNFTLIIALDCGIKSVEKVAYAHEKGIDFIICDHHRPGPELPAAFAILDPKQPGCSYPYKELSGCGIGFKLIQAFTAKKNIPVDDLISYLDLVVISIASDIVDITGENRVLAYYGLKLINTAPRPGIDALLKVAGGQKKENGGESTRHQRDLTITDLVFIVGPRINAAGRIESGRNSVRLLINMDPDEAMRLGEQINQYNIERKNLDSKATEQALEMIAADPRLKKAKSTVIYHPEWHKGVIGIVASRLTESYYRPTIVLTRSGDLITGSAR